MKNLTLLNTILWLSFTSQVAAVDLGKAFRVDLLKEKIKKELEAKKPNKLLLRQFAIL